MMAPESPRRSLGTSPGTGPVSNERGVALVIVLLVVSLLTVITVEFADSTNIYAHMTRNSLNGVQAGLLARSGINIGEAFLMHDEDPMVDGFAEEWCPEPRERSCRIDESFLQLPPNVRLRIEIFDESGKININSTRPTLNELENQDPANPTLPVVWQHTLQRLFEARGIDPIAVERLAEYWQQKLEENQEVADEADDTEPQGRKQKGDDPEGANPQNQNMSRSMLDALLDFPSLDDANVALGLSPRDLDRVRDLITALPKTQYRTINPNTAPREVLDAITGDGSISENVITQRMEAPLQQGDWAGLLGGLNTSDPEFSKVSSMARVTSRMYRVVASALVNPDPVSGRGGIARTASMMVRRLPAVGQRGGNASENARRWTLTRLDWQKEGGAKLFAEDQGLAPGAGEDEPSLF
jgi:type II secretory pathway component PulK